MIPDRRLRPEENVDSWLMSYADMVTLLLCFFIIFVSVSEPKKERLEAITEGLKGKFGAIDMATPFEGVFRTLRQVVETHQLLRDISIERAENGITAELSAVAFYRDKSADFDPVVEPVLAELVAALKNLEFMDYRVTIEGHTDDQPFSTPYYPSNWELSTARAARMARFFIERGIPAKRISATGYADSRPKVPNRDIHGDPIPENRRQNERVIVKIERAM